MKGALPKVLIGLTACVLVVAAAIAFRPDSSYTEAQDTVTYGNADFGYSLQYPSTWDMHEFDGANGLAMQVAFDPDEVIVDEGLDLAPGRVWIFVSDGMPNGGEATTVGDGIDARYFVERNDDDQVPNPWWVDRTDRRYEIALPNTVGAHTMLTIVVQYPNDLEDDATAQEEIDRILASFTFE